MAPARRSPSTSARTSIPRSNPPWVTRTWWTWSPGRGGVVSRTSAAEPSRGIPPRSRAALHGQGVVADEVGPPLLEQLHVDGLASDRAHPARLAGPLLLRRELALE